MNTDTLVQFILLVSAQLSIIPLYMQLQIAPTGSAHPYVTDMLTSAILVSIIAVALQFLYAFLRLKLTDLQKLKRAMKEVNEWRKEYMDAIRKQDKNRIEKLREKQEYMNRLNMEVMQMNFRPMMVFMVPMLIVWWAILPQVFGHTVAVSPISLNILGDLMPITCTKSLIVKDVNSISDELISKADEVKDQGIKDSVVYLAKQAKEQANEGKYIDAKKSILEAYRTLNSSIEKPINEKVPSCTAENEVLLWAWYAIASIAFSGIVMKITRTDISIN
jgi:Predicted membrane protein